MELPLNTHSLTLGLQTAAITSEGVRKQGPSYRTALDKRERKRAHTHKTLQAEKGNFSGMRQLNARSCSLRGKKSLRNLLTAHQPLDYTHTLPTGARITTKASWDRVIHLGRL